MGGPEHVGNRRTWSHSRRKVRGLVNLTDEGRESNLGHPVTSRTARNTVRSWNEGTKGSQIMVVVSDWIIDYEGRPGVVRIIGEHDHKPTRCRCLSQVT